MSVMCTEDLRPGHVILDKERGSGRPREARVRSVHPMGLDTDGVLIYGVEMDVPSFGLRAQWQVAVSRYGSPWQVKVPA